MDNSIKGVKTESVGMPVNACRSPLLDNRQEESANIPVSAPASSSGAAKESKPSDYDILYVAALFLAEKMNGEDLTTAASAKEEKAYVDALLSLTQQLNDEINKDTDPTLESTTALSCNSAVIASKESQVNSTMSVVANVGIKEPASNNMALANQISFANAGDMQIHRTYSR